MNSKIALRNRVIDRDGDRCVYCDEAAHGPSIDDDRIVRMTLDHLIPKSRGGVVSMSNLVCACTRCNSARGNRDLMSWLQTLNPGGTPHGERAVRMVLAAMMSDYRELEGTELMIRISDTFLLGKKDVECPECGARMLLCAWTREGPRYQCVQSPDCAGAFTGTIVPQSVDHNTKKARVAAHQVFESLLESGHWHPNDARIWMGTILEIPRRDAHIGRLTEQQCWKFIQAVWGRFGKRTELTWKK